MRGGTLHSLTVFFGMSSADLFSIPLVGDRRSPKEGASRSEGVNENFKNSVGIRMSEQQVLRGNRGTLFAAFASRSGRRLADLLAGNR